MEAGSLWVVLAIGPVPCGSVLQVDCGAEGEFSVKLERVGHDAHSGRAVDIDSAQTKRDVLDGAGCRVPDLGQRCSHRHVLSASNVTTKPDSLRCLTMAENRRPMPGRIETAHAVLTSMNLITPLTSGYYRSTALVQRLFTICWAASGGVPFADNPLVKVTSN